MKSFLTFISLKHSIPIIISFVLLYIIFRMANDNYETFQNINVSENQSTSHNVDMPLTTTQSCQNFCGPNSRCAKTGHQCFADVDCPGCQQQKTNSNSYFGKCVPGADDAGKLTVGVTPSYSPLTRGYGTREKAVINDMDSPAPQANFGVNTWMSDATVEQELYDRRYKPNQLQFMPNYDTKYSLTGMFTSDGPLPSNY